VGERKWVLNASPLILLGNIGRIDLLEALCAEMIVPAAVADEVCAGPCRDASQEWLAGSAQAYVRHMDQVDPVVKAWDLGAGESEVLTWARQNPGYEAILDDRAARSCALALGILVRGTLGVILLAKREGLIDRVQPVFQQLRDSGMRIADDVLDRALRLTGELDSG
jgi:predicted nucleic acid-binding protein